MWHVGRECRRRRSAAEPTHPRPEPGALRPCGRSRLRGPKWPVTHFGGPTPPWDALSRIATWASGSRDLTRLFSLRLWWHAQTLPHDWSKPLPLPLRHPRGDGAADALAWVMRLLRKTAMERCDLAPRSRRSSRRLPSKATQMMSQSRKNGAHAGGDRMAAEARPRRSRRPHCNWRQNRAFLVLEKISGPR